MSRVIGRIDISSLEVDGILASSFRKPTTEQDIVDVEDHYPIPGAINVRGSFRSRQAIPLGEIVSIVGRNGDGAYRFKALIEQVDITVPIPVWMLPKTAIDGDLVCWNGDVYEFFQGVGWHISTADPRYFYRSSGAFAMVDGDDVAEEPVIIDRSTH